MKIRLGTVLLVGGMGYMVYKAMQNTSASGAIITDLDEEIQDLPYTDFTEVITDETGNEYVFTDEGTVTDANGIVYDAVTDPVTESIIIQPQTGMQTSQQNNSVQQPVKNNATQTGYGITGARKHSGSKKFPHTF